MYYGQWDTDAKIEQFFESGYIGTAIEVGAADGIICSNTKYFEDKGWQTLCIEANPNYVEKCKTNRKMVYESAVGKEYKENVPFEVFDIGSGNLSAISGLEPDYRLIESHKHLIQNRYIVNVTIRTMNYILSDIYVRDNIDFTDNIDFVSIDTEGTELDVLKGFNLVFWKPKLLVIENNHNESFIEEYLKEYNYSKIMRYEVNDFFVYEKGNKK
jgi:FkbM family methyltransferase